MVYGFQCFSQPMFHCEERRQFRLMRDIVRRTRFRSGWRWEGGGVPVAVVVDRCWPPARYRVVSAAARPRRPGSPAQPDRQPTPRPAGPLQPGRDRGTILTRSCRATQCYGGWPDGPDSNRTGLGRTEQAGRGPARLHRSFDSSGVVPRPDGDRRIINCIWQTFSVSAPSPPSRIHRRLQCRRTRSPLRLRFTH